MRLATFHDDDRLRVGVVSDNQITPFTDDPTPVTIRDLIEMESLPLLDHTAARPLPSVRLGPAVPEPRNILCVGKNYPMHAAEEGTEVPPVPLLFGKHTSAVCGPSDAIEWDPAYTSQVDWEVELAVVIGKDARRVAVADALDVVFAYTAANDVSARDLQFGDGQWHRGKSLETFLPIGPVLVTPDELGDPQTLDLECRVNNVVKQAGNTAQMFYSIAEVISFASQAFTLRAGDIILTGTPDGVGVFREPPEFLKDGDVVKVEIESIGVLSNACIEQTAHP